MSRDGRALCGRMIHRRTTGTCKTDKTFYVALVSFLIAVIKVLAKINKRQKGLILSHSSIVVENTVTEVEATVHIAFIIWTIEQ